MKKVLFILLLLPLLTGCTLTLPGGDVPVPIVPVNPVNKVPMALYSISHRIPYVGQEVVFNGTYSRDEDGWIVSWRWDLGPAGIQTGSIVTVVFCSAGEFAMTLTVTDNGGASNSIYRRIKVDVPSTCGTSPVIPCPG